MARRRKKNMQVDAAQITDWARNAATANLPDSAEIRVLKKEIESLKRKLNGKVSGENLIIDAVRHCYETPVDLVIPQSPKLKSKRGADEEIAVLHISDTQIGKITSSYDSTIAELRLIELVRKTIQITEMRRSTANISEIRVYLGGDIVEGEDIFPHQAHLIDQSVFDQAIRAAPSMLARCILLLLENFPKVKVVCVPGNHGRNGNRGTRSHPKTNWDNVCYAVTNLMLSGTKDTPAEWADRLEFIEPYQAGDWYAVDRVFEWGNLIVHGDQITGGFAGFPWYGAAKKAWGWIDSIPEPWDYLWFGHFHTYAEGTLNYRTFLANGTTESDNTYAQEQLAAAGWPCQRLSFFNSRYGLIANNPIYLTSPDERRPAKDRGVLHLASQA
jgi:hypothetical protein